jgi:hypothetical protein
MVLFWGALGGHLGQMRKRIARRLRYAVEGGRPYAWQPERGGMQLGEMWNTSRVPTSDADTKR